MSFNPDPSAPTGRRLGRRAYTFAYEVDNVVRELVKLWIVRARRP